jgi:hypothetical protein
LSRLVAPKCLFPLPLRGAEVPLRGASLLAREGVASDSWSRQRLQGSSRSCEAPTTARTRPPASSPRPVGKLETSSLSTTLPRLPIVAASPLQGSTLTSSPAADRGVRSLIPHCDHAARISPCLPLFPEISWPQPSDHRWVPGEALPTRTPYTQGRGARSATHGRSLRRSSIGPYVDQARIDRQPLRAVTPVPHPTPRASASHDLRLSTTLASDNASRTPVGPDR